MTTVHEYVHDYEYRGDQDHVPTEDERAMLEDAIEGYIAILPPKLSGGSPDELLAEAFELSCNDQFDLATKIAENVGYVLAPEPEHPNNPHAKNVDRAAEGKAKAALAYLIEHVEYQDSYGVHGSDFTACRLCHGGGAPGIKFEHEKLCPVTRCLPIAQEWWGEREEERGVDRTASFLRHAKT
jgi:hypothetical protein